MELNVIDVYNLLVSFNKNDRENINLNANKLIKACEGNKELIENIKQELNRLGLLSSKLNKVKEVDGESFNMAIDKSIKVEDVILTPDNKANVEKIMKEQNYRESFKKYNLRAINKFLFYGASGCGKTYLGTALANTLGYNMLYVDIARALSQGNVAENLESVFKIGNKGNYLIFLDEADSIAWDRDAANAEDGNMRRAINGLFQQIDKMNPDSMLVCATNMIHRLDVAFKRRFNLLMEFVKPKGDMIEPIKKFVKPPFVLKGIRDVLDEVEERKLEKVSGSYYAIQGMCERAMKTAIMKGTFEITIDDIYNEAEYKAKSKIELIDTSEIYTL